MVAQQILRVAVQSRIAAAVLSFVTVLITPLASVHAGEDAIIIDLRHGDSAQLAKSRMALRLEFGKVQGIRILGGSAMDAALRGDKDKPLLRRGKNSLTAAAIAYGRLDCKAARRAARLAMINYTALQATKANVHAELRRAYVYILLCAHGANDKAGAQLASSRLRALGFTKTPDGVTETVWKMYPRATPSPAPIPVPGSVPVPPSTTTGPTGELQITGPGGAAVWVDHKHRGKAPLTLTLTVGEHVVAVANTKGNAAAQLTKVKSGHTSIKMTIQTADPRWEPVRRTVAGWKTAGRVVSTKRLAEVLRRLKVRFGFVVTSDRISGKVVVWGVQKYRKAARRLGAASPHKPIVLAALVTDHASAWDGRSPDPSMPLLTEGNTKKLAKKPHKWWVYASIIGAVALGAAIIIAQDAADDSQRIRLTFP